MLFRSQILKRNGLSQVYDRTKIKNAIQKAFFGLGAEISEDEIKELEERVQKLTDKYIAEIDKAVESKTKEILTV